MKNPAFNTQHAVFAALSKSNEGYALQLIRQVNEMTGGKASLTKAAMYGALKKMVEHGWLETRVEPIAPQRRFLGGRPTVYYRLTDDGRRKADEVRCIMMQLWSVDN